MNFLQQTKLTKTEWDMIEIPVESEKERQILTMIQSGYDNTELQYMSLVYIVIIVLSRTVFNLKQFFRFSGKWNRMSKKAGYPAKPYATQIHFLYCNTPQNSVLHFLLISASQLRNH